MKERKSLSINIPDPCKQAWSDMAPVEDGRFCQHCQKKVVDFSAMTDQEIITVIHKSEGKLCGRLIPVIITLQQSKTDLDEIVVTGYGVTKRTAITGGYITVVKGEVVHRLTWWQRITSVFRKKHECTH